MSNADQQSKPARGRLTLDDRTRELLRRFFVDWVRPRRRELAVSLVLSALFAAVTPLYPWILRTLFDSLEKGSAAHLPGLIAAIIGAPLLRSIVLYLQTVASNGLVTRITTDIQQRSFRHLLEADYARITRDRPGDFVSRLTNDLGYIQLGTQSALNAAIKDTLTILALIAYLLWRDWQLTLIVLVVLPLAAVPVTAIASKLRDVARRTQSGLEDMTSLLTEKLSGARLIKTFGLEDYAAAKADRSFDAIYRLKMKAVRSRGAIDPVLEVLGALAVAGVVALAYWRISQGGSSVGEFVGFAVALFLLAPAMRGLGNLAARVNEGLSAVERVYDLLDEKPSVVDRATAKPLSLSSGTIDFEGVGFGYAGATDLPAVHDFTLRVPGGKTVALVGRSGAGKSTIINLVPRLFDTTAGRILIDGQDIRDVTLSSLRGAIAIVSQDVTLFDDTIRANIALGKLGASTAEIEAAAKAAAAHEFILAQPNGYDTEIGDRGMRLSGGQRQRLALARAILKDAPILLLDEATSALDTESEQLVQEALARFTRNRTTLVIAHRLSTVQSADLICVMEAGTMLEVGTHSDLLAKDGAYARLAHAQLLTGSDSPPPPRRSA